MHIAIYQNKEVIEDNYTLNRNRSIQWERGEEVPHVVNFEDRARLRQLLTDRRLDLLEEVMERPPESI